MDLSKLTYKKSNSTIELPKNAVQTTSKAKRERQKTINIPHVDVAYEKQEGFLSSNLFFVLSGGEKKRKTFLKNSSKNQICIRFGFSSCLKKGRACFHIRCKRNG